MKGLKWLLPLAVVVIGGFLAVVIARTGPKVEAKPPEPFAPLVRVTRVERGPVSMPVRTHGTVEPRTESELVPEVSGRVIWKSPALVSGGFFDEGEPLLRIETVDFDVALEQARANLARARSEAARAQNELVRQRTLAAQNVASAARLEDAENASRVAEASVRQNRAALRKAERDLTRAEIRAPFRGRVRTAAVDVGQFVNRGNPAARLYAIDFAEIRLPIADEELAHLDLPLGASFEAAGSGLAVVLSAEFAGSRHRWTGNVVRTEGEIDRTSQMVHVVARVDDPYATEGGRPPLGVGLFVEAEIAGRELTEAVVLPRAALRDDGYVLVVDAEERLHIRSVGVARVTEDEVVISSGLESGERVVTSALPTAVDGMLVRSVAEAANPVEPAAVPAVPAAPADGCRS